MNITNAQPPNQNVLEALDNIAGSLASLTAGVNHLKVLLMAESVEPAVEEFDPRDPANKYPNKKLTPCGEEICYRLFDAGNSRYAVAAMLDISFSAAKHRHTVWQKLGGAQRVKQSLE